MARMASPPFLPCTGLLSSSAGSTGIPRRRFKGTSKYFRAAKGPASEGSGRALLLARPMPAQGFAPARALRRAAHGRSSTMVSSSNGSLPLEHGIRPCPGRSVLVHDPTSIVATALPEKFVTARASDMNRSMPTIRPTPSSRSGRWLCSPPARVARPGAADARRALGGDDHEHQQRRSAHRRPAGLPSASAMNSDAIVR